MITFSREITLGDLVVAVGLFVPVIIWAATMQARQNDTDVKINAICQQIVETQRFDQELKNNYVMLSTIINDRLNIKP